MHPHEEALIRAFIVPHRRARWLQSVASPKRRRSSLDGLNHCADLDPRFTAPLPSNADVVRLLREHGAPLGCYVISDATELDGREMLLAEAVQQVVTVGWGTIISCLSGQLAYYRDEGGSRQFLLVREDES